MEANNSQHQLQDISSAGNVRQDLIDTAVKFLQNPKVINSALAQKQTFLQRRGLTEEEIRLACEKSGAYDHHEQQQFAKSAAPPALPQPTNMITSYRGYGPLRVSWFDKLRDVVHSVAIFSIVAYVIKKFYDTYVSPFLFGKKKSIEEKIDSLEKSVESKIETLQGSVETVKTELDKISYSSEKELASELRDLKGDIATVKGLLLTRKQFPSVTTPVVPPSIPAWQMSSVHGGADGEEHKEELLEVGSGSGSSEPDGHGMKTSESSLEIINPDDVV